ncbi:MAG: nucleotidyltransferase domain-containing protein [Methanosarcinales archaeon Met12]|nr:MAG: nucleotidyltransferase domain-containing protein [Methanosarcinales archaeon Met12]
MIELFEKYVDWKILAFFLRNPTTTVYVKELARRLHVSPGSVSKAVKRFAMDNLLLKEEKGLAHLYKLNNESAIVKSLKKAYSLMRIHELKIADKFLDADENIISLALYGSYATGDYDEKSDIDLLAITPSGRYIFTALINDLERDLVVEISLEVSNLSQWRSLARKNDVFYRRVIENHVLLRGSGLK